MGRALPPTACLTDQVGVQLELLALVVAPGIMPLSWDFIGAGLRRLAALSSVSRNRDGTEGVRLRGSVRPTTRSSLTDLPVARIARVPAAALVQVKVIAYVVIRPGDAGLIAAGCASAHLRRQDR